LDKNHKAGLNATQRWIRPAYLLSIQPSVGLEVLNPR
jgi:hypothetical protein